MSFFTPPPPTPVGTDPATFRTRAINAWAWLYGTLLNEFDALYSLFTAAVAAMNTNDTRDTSTSSVLIGVGTKVFTVSTGKSFSAGQWLTLSNTPAPTNQMIGNVASYSGTTLTVNVPANGVFGSGTLAAWTIALTAAPSAQISAAMTPVAAAATLVAGRAALEVDTDLKSIDYTLGGNALTLKLNPSTISFRSTTLTNGAPTSVSNAAQISLTIPDTATLGTISGVQSNLIEIAINNAGTMEVGVVNLAGGVVLDEQGIINTTALSAASDSANVIYSTTARTGVAYKVVGLFRSTQTVAGTWDQPPSLVQGVGGQALAAMSSFGYGQTGQDLTGSRSLATTYYNTTGKPITVRGVAVTAGGGFGALTLTVGALSQTITAPAGGYGYSVSDIVLPGESYSITAAGTANATFAWHEKR